MNKLALAVLVTMFLSTSAAFARPEINVKAGLDLYNDSSSVIDWNDGDGSQFYETETSDCGFQFGGEILFPIGRVVKLGGGFAYAAPRQINTIM